MDLCKELLAAARPAEPGTVLAVTAGKQTAGRGTGGRQWESPTGNVSLTVSMPKAHIPDAVLPVYPLLAGIAIRDCIAGFVRRDDAAGAGPRVQAKWPNDVLIDGAKASGCIIEDAGDSLLVGVGINVATAPSTGDAGRRTACLHEHGATEVSAEACARDCTERLVRATVEAASREAVVDTYRAAMAMDCPMYRRLPDGRRGKKVTPVMLGAWGEMTVVDEDGVEETLIADYLI